MFQMTEAVFGAVFVLVVPIPSVVILTIFRAPLVVAALFAPTIPVTSSLRKMIESEAHWWVLTVLAVRTMCIRVVSATRGEEASLGTSQIELVASMRWSVLRISLFQGKNVRFEVTLNKSDRFRAILRLVLATAPTLFPLIVIFAIEYKTEISVSSVRIFTLPSRRHYSRDCHECTHKSHWNFS